MGISKNKNLDRTSFIFAHEFNLLYTFIKLSFQKSENKAYKSIEVCVEVHISISN